MHIRGYKMGSGISKTEKYVLRVDDAPGTGLSNIRGGGSTGDEAISESPMKPKITRQNTAKSIIPGASKQIVPLSDSLSYSSSSSPSPAFSPPVISFGSPESPESRKSLKQQAVKNLNPTLICAVAGGSMKVNGLSFSAKLPWLLKSANINIISSAEKELDFGRVIGTGLMGFVRAAKFKNSKQYFAVKGIKKDYIIRHRDERHVQNERTILSRIRSDFCVKLFGTFQDNNAIYFIMELVIGGELFRRLSKKECFMPQTAKFYATEICSALLHIHKLGWCYRDLKPENVMLDEYGHCKLVDFGFSKECSIDEQMHTVCGTPAYLSPEQLNGKFTNGYTRIVDWWAFGVFIYELLTGNTPFCEDNSETPYAIYLRILNSEIRFPMGFEPNARDFIASLCCADLNKRLVVDASIGSHSYFVIDWKDVRDRKLVPPFVPKISSESDLHYFDTYPEPHFKECDHSMMFEGF